MRTAVCFVFVIACAQPPDSVGQGCQDIATVACDWVERCFPNDPGLPSEDDCVNITFESCCAGDDGEDLCRDAARADISPQEWAACLHDGRNEACSDAWQLPASCQAF